MSGSTALAYVSARVCVRIIIWVHKSQRIESFTRVQAFNISIQRLYCEHNKLYARVSIFAYAYVCVRAYIIIESRINIIMRTDRRTHARTSHRRAQTKYYPLAQESNPGPVRNIDAPNQLCYYYAVIERMSVRVCNYTSSENRTRDLLRARRVSIKLLMPECLRACLCMRKSVPASVRV